MRLFRKPTLEEYLLKKLAERYVDGKLTEHEHAEAVEAVLVDADDHHAIDGQCLVCDCPTNRDMGGMFVRSPATVCVPCPACQRTRDADQIPRVSVP